MRKIICIMFGAFLPMIGLTQIKSDSLTSKINIGLGISVLKFPRTFLNDEIKFKRFYIYIGLKYKRKLTNRFGMVLDYYAGKGDSISFVGNRDIYINYGLEWFFTFKNPSLRIIYGADLIFHNGYANTQDSKVDTYQSLVNGGMIAPFAGLDYNINDRIHFTVESNLALAFENKNLSKIINGATIKESSNYYSFYITRPLLIMFSFNL